MLLTDHLSDHFVLGELVHSSHRTIDNHPPPPVVEQLRSLCVNLLEPLRARFGALYVTSGYRCPTLNRVIGGTLDSAHVYGCAADVVPIAPGATLDNMIRWVSLESGLPFDQVIVEHTTTSGWLHLGALRPNHEAAPRRQALRYRDGIYSPWAPPTATA